MAISLPESSSAWLKAFSARLNEEARRYQIRLVGGDTTKGPLTLSLQVQGLLPKGKGLYRNKAKPGDIICVSGCLGDAAGALNYLDDEAVYALDARVSALLEAYYCPVPPVALGVKLIGNACCAMDISDGLLADLSHILDKSSVGATLLTDSIPLSAALQALLPESALDLALNGGDDYQLLVCLPAVNLGLMSELGLIAIGEVTQERELFLQYPDGTKKTPNIKGYQHF